ncbi:MAG TPA: divalent-cation tolerance protein CutA [Pyrinomonadaceae bacterium]|jgi:periplasmic divalent cation tolerance protein|nr:divalent-cation tolerance protein CutA [Pyrinomonadaceae bacterium]
MNADSHQAIAVFITAPNPEEAAQLAEMLVGQRLAACVQIMRETQSIFRWQGKVESQREVLLIAKTVASKFAEIEREVTKLHSYETPEIVAFPLTHGSQPYLEWLAASVRAKDQTEF